MNEYIRNEQHNVHGNDNQEHEIGRNSPEHKNQSAQNLKNRSIDEYKSVNNLSDKEIQDIERRFEQQVLPPINANISSRPQRNRKRVHQYGMVNMDDICLE